jgi:2-dehydropantoate 2-reductase
MSGPGGPGVLLMGAGAIGCYLGGCLQAAGEPVVFVGRPRVLDALRRHGLTLTDLNGRRCHVDAASLALHTAVPDGIRPGLVLLAVKSGATVAAAAELAAAVPGGTLVVSTQNGVGNAAAAQAAAPGLRVLPGMVPFNVAELAPGHYHRGTDGMLAMQRDAALVPWQAPFERAGLPVALHEDMRAVLWAKLLLNLNNPVNALSGLPLRAQLLDQDFRRVLAALQDEALRVLAAAGVAPARLTPLPPRLIPRVLRLPTPLFRLVAARMLRIDDKARSSMADDLAQGRPTEVDALCGEVVRLAQSLGASAPLNQRMVELVRAEPAQRRTLTARQLTQALGMR